MRGRIYCAHHCADQECFRNRSRIEEGSGRIRWSYFCGCEGFRPVKFDETELKKLALDHASFAEFKKNYTSIWIVDKKGE